MATRDEITIKIRELANISAIVAEYLKPEYMTAKALSDDTNQLLRVKMDLMKEVDLIKQSNENAKKEKAVILAQAAVEAQVLKRAAEEYLVKASKENDAAAKEHEEAKRLKYLVQKELDKLKRAVA